MFLFRNASTLATAALSTVGLMSIGTAPSSASSTIPCGNMSTPAVHHINSASSMLLSTGLPSATVSSAIPCDTPTLDTRSTVGNLTVSIDGKCGNNVTCLTSIAGDSCSKWGYCGPFDDDSYSGKGCMPKFGLCSANATVGDDAPTKYIRSTFSNLTVSTNGECSGSQTCLGSAAGDSCSQWGYCGPLNDTAYSGPGCMPAFGLCATNSTAGNGTSNSTATSTAAPTTLMTITSSTSVAASTSSSSAAASSSADSSSTSPASYSYSPTSTASAAPSATPSGSSGSGSTAPSSEYTEFLGTGTVADGWPSQNKWKSFDDLFAMNHDILNSSCQQWDVPDNSDTEINDIKSAIQAISKSSGVDPRFMLAITLQESNGCVRAPTTALAVSNPGLLQSYAGKANCNTGSATAPANVQSPCPSTEIHNMISEGTTGTVPGGMSLEYALKKAGTTDVSKYYKAARIYNSGSIASSGLLQDGVATHCYASDIANRLLGWSLGPGKCTLNAA